MHLLPSTLLALVNLALTSTSAAQESQLPSPSLSSCGTTSQPNPIAAQYYANITGTLNGTLAILPIPLSLARRIVPSKYEILTQQYRDLMPDLPEDTYPALLQAVFDHDIRFMEYSMPDFSRASIEFPFLRYFADEETPFRWVPDMFMTSTNQMGINASREYGGNVYPSTFSPACDAYAHAAEKAADDEASTTFGVEAETAFLHTTWETAPSTASSPFPLSFFKNAINQPMFGDKGFCNHQTRLFSTPLSTGAYAPRQVVGTVKMSVPDVFGKEGREWRDVVGVQVDTAFIERHMIECEEMRGWRYNEVEEVVGGEEDGKWKLEL